MPPLSLYDITIPIFIHHLKTINNLLDKGEAHVGSDHAATLVNLRLVADMQPLSFQVQRVSKISTGVAALVGSAEAITFEDNEKTLPELHERINKTIAYLEKVDPKSFVDAEDKEVILKNAAGERKFTGSSYVSTFALPNFYFHFVTLYALLRKEGVQIGKRDFLT
ncbi:hypothetical protein G7Y89_g11269 [Cudoniella acicularis]|uniref:DUF1993 domain-containing protein n=1 Tax=Cudoniella acicularis TaxID=354080 RepID=A0A8H4RES9_9HELO|nr:hypothetical protein G7Y89_g11269 [Cudoniella acicularis]